MKVLIETYRKIPIYFDTDGEIFESSINDSFYGNPSYKGSYIDHATNDSVYYIDGVGEKLINRFIKIGK